MFDPATVATCFALILVPNGNDNPAIVLSGYPSAAEARAAGQLAERPPMATACDPKGLVCAFAPSPLNFRDKRVIPAPAKDCEGPNPLAMLGYNDKEQNWRRVRVDTQGRLIVSPESPKP